MMRQLRHGLACLLICSSANLYAQDTAADQSLESLGEYLKNLGAYLGFDITQPPESGPVATLLDISATTLAEQYVFITELGAIPVNAFTDALAYFVPSDTSSYALINDMANYTFGKQPNSGGYNSTSTGNSGGISVSELIDQQTYQNDPVIQAALNIVATPDATYCMNNNATDWKSDCQYLYNTKIMTNVIGPTPSTDQFFSYDYNQNIVPQLTANTLLAPLMYSTEDTSSSTSSSDAANTSSSHEGLTAQNQAQNALNFIRYATGMVSPPSLPKRADYDALYAQAISTDTSIVSNFDKQLAQEKIAKYLTKLRSYSARVSIGAGNLFFILSKRMPQAQSDDSSTKSSQALSEFQMATRRLYDPSKKGQGTQWIDQINNASTATVQKEIAVLLSEINYQLYLSRQIDERILATLSVLGSGAITPPDFSSDADIEIQATPET